VIGQRDVFQRSEASDGQWIRRFILGHPTRHPQDMGAATPHQAVRAIWLLYQAGLKANLGWLDEDDVRTVQAWLGHQDVTTTMIDTHVLNHGG
jgi:integrase